jgi:hypothetical protein
VKKTGNNAMPGMRLNDTERRLRQWWLESNSFPYPTLRRITINGDPGLRGIQEITINFAYPLTVMCGKNGCGKTTILALAALGFHSPPEHFPINAHRRPRKSENFTYYTFRDFFFKGPNDPDITGIEVSWEYDNGKKIHIQKRSDKWMRYERRPPRPVHYLGIRRSLPAIEQSVLRSYFGGKWKGSETKALKSAFRDRVGDIMGRSYDEAGIISSSVYSVRSCKFGNIYSSFNMGSGEDILIHLMYLLQGCPNGSIIVIEEIEIGFHPEALIRLAKHLQGIILKKKLQVIVSTHSTHFIDSVPREARVLVQRAGKEHTSIPQPTTRFALGDMAGQADPELHIYCEDYFASLLIGQVLPADLRKRTHIVPVGSKSEMAMQAAFHFRADFGQHILLIWDGDVTREEAGKYLQKANESLKDAVGSRGHFKQRLNWGFLPGHDTPEWWSLSILDSTEGYVLLGRELNSSEAYAAEVIERLRSLNDHRELGHELERRTNIAEQDALRMLARSISSLTSEPLKCVQKMVRAVLDGKQVQVGDMLQ